MGLIAIENGKADCPKGVSYDEFHNYYKEIGDTHNGYRLVREDRETLYSWRDREENALLQKKIGHNRCVYSLPDARGMPNKYFFAFVLEKVRDH